MTLLVGCNSSQVSVVDLGYRRFATIDDTLGGDRVFLAGGGSLSCRSAFLWGSSNIPIESWRKVCWAL